MGKYRKRFNEKARAGMLAKQAALKSARNKQFTRDLDEGSLENPTDLFASENPNSDIYEPISQAEKDERKRKLTETLYSENAKEAKLSRAKKKRLDKYIDHQIKREEKKVLLEKLAETRVDTKALAPSKLLGTGKQTRREEIVEALDLEKQGLASDRTRNILYEEREVKEWESDSEPVTKEEEEAEESSASTFVDFRPQKLGGTGSGFGFGDLPKIEKKPAKKKYTWRLALEREEKKRSKIEEDDDFLSSEEDGAGDNGESDENHESDSEDSTKNLASDEFGGFSDDASETTEVKSESEAAESEASEDTSEDESDESQDESPRLLSSKPRHSEVAQSFKEWAEEQARKLDGPQSEALPELSEDLKAKYANGLHIKEESDDESVSLNPNPERKAFFVNVSRPEEIQQQRMQLPVFSEEHRIMEAIHHNDTLLLCGETGSGKTTQVPQFLYEAGFGHPGSEYPGMIGITQPRRVAAVSMAQRVGAELGDHGHRVGYQIRFDSTITNEGTENGTAMKFMTDGVLLREMMTDLLLLKYSVLIIDEAHERNVNTDILIGMLSRVVNLRRQRNKPLKLVIMSATLRVSDFSENQQLFKKPPPIINVEARQFPVSIHFNKHTRHDYLEEAFQKTCKIHRRLPPGGILIFLTGQNEITALVKRLRREFRGNYQETDAKYKVSRQVTMEAEDVDLDIALREHNELDEEESGSGSDSEEGFEEELEEGQTPNDPLYVLPLYSLLPTTQQMKVFEEPPKGSRMCIVATNVAETSLTIPGIRYVVDCGRSKERKFKEETGVQSFEVDWISKASADQRSGRAGRTGPGHCYRLFSSALYEEFFEQFSKPEILRMPVESTVLTMKSMAIDHIVNFPFPTPPDRSALALAEQLLVTLGALDKDKTITDLGRTMSLFPLGPRFAKILIIGNQLECLPYVISIVSALSVGDPFLGEHEVSQVDPEASQGDKEAARKTRGQYLKARAMFSKLDNCLDALRLLSAVCAFDHVPEKKRDEFLKAHFLRPKVMEEIQKLRHQIASIVAAATHKDGMADVPIPKKLGVPSKQQVAALKQIVTSGFVDQVAARADVVEADMRLSKKTNITAVPYTTVFPSKLYEDETDPHVYIHPALIISLSGAAPPEYLVYQSLNLGLNQRENSIAKLRMKPLVDVTGRQLANVGRALVTYSKPLGHPYGPKEISPTKRECYVVPRFGANIGEGRGWDLPVLKVTQVKKAGLWITEV